MQQKSEKHAALVKKAKMTSRVVYRGYLTVRVDTFKLADGTTQSYDLILHPGAVVVLPVNENDELLLVKQWRLGAQQILLELPAGTLEEGEPPVLCAGRELQEEIGFRADQLIPLGGFYSAPGFCTEYLHFFLAKDLSPSTLPSEDGEGIDVITLSLDKALEMIDNGTICDLKTIAGILRYERWLRTSLK